MKKFLKEEVEAGNYNDVTVRWERGHPVTLVMYDEESTEIERHNVEGWSVDKVRETLRRSGFTPMRTVLPKPSTSILGFSDTGTSDRATQRTQPIDLANADARD